VAFLEDGVAMADANGIVLNHALWSTWLGEAYLAAGRIADARRTIEGAEQCYRAALTLAEELEMRPLQARCQLGLGNLYRRIGRVDEARAALSTAVSILREMEMTYWLPEAETELSQADGMVVG
jgi:tetratricopeptide (TPR) repeat protein